MKNILFLLIVLSLASCNSEKLLFEKETWWNGHWQNAEDATIFFSSGHKPVGGNEIFTPQFFISTRDTIHSNFHLKNLIDYNHKRKWKIIETNDNRYIKIKEVNESHIEVSGPLNSIEELETNIVDYMILPDNVTPPIPDSILFSG